jgi:hypothetical protein
MISPSPTLIRLAVFGRAIVYSFSSVNSVCSVVQFFAACLCRFEQPDEIAMSQTDADNHAPQTARPARPAALWTAHGIILALLMVFLAIAMNTFAYPYPFASKAQKAAQDSIWWWTRMIVFLTAGLLYIAGLLLVGRARPNADTQRAAGPLPAIHHNGAGSGGGRSSSTRKLILFIVLVAVVMRLPAFWMPGKNGFDYNRYLWDGAVLAHGHNPYQYTPDDIVKHDKGDATIRELVNLKGSGAFDHVAYTGGDILDRCNHPELKTPYPPLAQAFFALGHLIAPFNLAGWRVVLMLFDALAALSVLSLLRASKLPIAWWAAYMWNPIIIQEAYIDAHLEMIVAAGLIIFAWCLCRKKFISAAAVLAAAAAVKIWPAALILFILRPAWRQKLRLVLALAIFAIVAAALLLPQRFATGATGTEGVSTYLWSSHDNQGAHWVCDQAEDYLRGRVPAVQDLGHWLETRINRRADVLTGKIGTIDHEHIDMLTWPADAKEPTHTSIVTSENTAITLNGKPIKLANLKDDMYATATVDNGGIAKTITARSNPPGNSDALARIFGYMLPWLAFLTWMALRPWKNSYQLCFNMGLAMLMFWLLAPTNYPWYFITVLIFGAVTLRPALLLWSLLLTLTHLIMGADFLPGNAFWTFILQYNLIIWLVHLPIWILLILELLNIPRRAEATLES